MAINKQKQFDDLRRHWAEQLPLIRGQDVTLYQKGGAHPTWGRLHIIDCRESPAGQPWEIVLITAGEHIHVNADNPWRIKTVHT